jgi:hypothetical protein
MINHSRPLTAVQILTIDEANSEKLLHLSTITMGGEFSQRRPILNGARVRSQVMALVVR